MIGRTLGRYRILAKLGQGGLATVWKAHDELLGRTVAIKILDPALAGQEKARRRFLHEARAASMLDHPGIVAVFDAAEIDGVAFIALSQVDGDTVSDLAARRLLPIAEAVRIVIAAADALGHAHSRQVIHRDVTARNIMVARDGRVFVLDFGLAIAVGASRLTTSETTIGTISYMAPEVLRGADADVRSDVYGLGVVLFEALTGGHPFGGQQRQSMVYAALNRQPTSPRALRPEIPAELERIVLKAIAREPRDRHASAGELLRDLRAFDTGSDAAGAVARNPAAGTPAADLPASAPVEPGRTASTTKPYPLYLAVRPFASDESDADPDGSAARLAARLPDTLSAALARSAAVRVVSQAAAAAETTSEIEPRALARELGANALLRGSVASSGSSIRVTWTVLDPARTVDLAGGVVDGAASDLFDLEDRVIASVAGGLGLGAAPVDGPRSRPRDPAASERFAQALGYLKRYDNEASVDGAIGLLENLIASEGESASVHATLARANLYKAQLTRQRVWESRAATACARARELDPDHPDVLLALGQLELVVGRHAEAIGHFRRAAELCPDSIEARIGWVHALEAGGRFADAERICGEAVADHPDDWRGHSLLGLLYSNRGRYSQALGAWSRVVELTPDNARGRQNVGTALHHLDRLEEAVEAFQAALRIRPNTMGYVNLGTGLYYLGRFEEAAAALRKAIELTPSDVVAWGTLGNAYRWMPGHESESAAALDRAIALMRERLERNPEDARSLAQLAGWLAGRKCNPQALDAIRKALDLAPENVDCMVRAGYVFEELGDRTQSIHWFREAVERGYGVEELRRSIELAPLREDPGFQRILSEASGARRTPREANTHGEEKP